MTGFGNKHHNTVFHYCLVLQNTFVYYSVTFVTIKVNGQPSSVLYMHHVKEKALLAIMAMNDIREPYHKGWT